MRGQKIPNIDKRTIDERIRGMAVAASSFEVVQKRLSIKGLMRMRIAPLMENGKITFDPVSISESDIFDLAYGDRLGSDYWKAWIFDANRVQLIELLALHCAPSWQIYEQLKLKLEERLSTVHEQPVRSDISLLVNNPNTRAYVPKSLVAFMSAQLSSLEDDLNSSANLPDRPPGPKPEKRERVIAEMKAIPRDELEALSGKQMVHKFRAGKTTVTEARNRVLDGITGVRLPANGK